MWLLTLTGRSTMGHMHAYICTRVMIYIYYILLDPPLRRVAHVYVHNMCVMDRWCLWREWNIYNRAPTYTYVHRRYACQRCMHACIRPLRSEFKFNLDQNSGNYMFFVMPWWAGHRRTRMHHLYAYIYRIRHRENYSLTKASFGVSSAFLPSLFCLLILSQAQPEL